MNFKDVKAVFRTGFKSIVGHVQEKINPEGSQEI